jgi:cytochrome c oxidase assembly protein subunit 15
VGGLTRLTESGLSIVEWNVIQGMRPPLTQGEWEAEFAKYQLFPEFQLTNHAITLEEFKFIFFMEWAHRMLGRFIGLTFVLPGAYFAYRGYLSRPLQLRSLAVGGLIGVQGLLGWLMVKSGLSAHLVEERQVPRVSHFWLAAHLGTAFTIYSAMLMTALEVLRSPRPAGMAAAAGMPVAQAAKLLPFARLAKGLAALVFVTAMSGALVAGLDAGLLYNEFPYMGTGLVPSDMWAFSTPSPSPGAEAGDVRPARMSAWRNLLENPSAVQFNHRLLAMSTLTATTGLWVYARRLPLPARARLAMHAVLGVACGQVMLGIATLIYFVPTPVAATHQAGSLTLLSAALWLVHTLRFLR